MTFIDWAYILNALPDLMRGLGMTLPAEKARVQGLNDLLVAGTTGVTSLASGVLLDQAGRQEEIARMLSGAEVTPEARAQADRLLEGV